MSNLKNIINHDTAAYVAAQAAAEWLSGSAPAHIYRRDRNPTKRARNFPEECSELLALNTSFTPLRRVEPATAGQEQLIHATVMKQAFVSMAGLSCPENLCFRGAETITGLEARSYGFELLARDLKRTGRILEALVPDRHAAVDLAFSVLDAIRELFGRAEVSDRLEAMTLDLLSEGVLSRGDIDQHLEGLEVYQTFFPDTSLSWSARQGLMSNSRWARVPRNTGIAVK